MTMTPAEVIAEMRERVGTSNYVVPVTSVERWADALERAMREPASKIDALGYGVNYTHLPPGTQLYTLPPDAVRLINEQMAEIEKLRGQWWVIRTKDAEIERLTADLASVRKAARDFLARIEANPERTLLKAAIFE